MAGRSISRIPLLAGFLIVGLAWAALSMWTGWHVIKPGFPDGFQSVGAALGRHPGHLAWPFVGTFEGYDQTWGYHWFGWPMVRSWLGVFLPWSSLGDAALLHVLRFGVAVHVALLVHARFRSNTGAWVGFLTVLFHRGWFASMAFLDRPETWASVLLWFAAVPLLSSSPRKWHGWVAAICLVFAPSAHPLALAGGGIIALAGTFRDGRKALWKWWLPLFAGMVWFACYYQSDPIRLHQLKDTLGSMRGLKSGMVQTFARLFLDPRNVFFSAPLLCITACSALAWWRADKPTRAEATPVLALSMALALLAPLYLIATGHPNIGHGATVAPFIGFAAGVAFHLMSRFSRGWSRLGRLALGGQALACGLPLVLATIAVAAFKPSSPRERARQVLAEALATGSGSVFIPLSLWEAAAERPEEEWKRIRFTTFPNLVPNERRVTYEKQSLSILSDGDILVVDGDGASDPAGILPWPLMPVLQGEAGPWRRLVAYEPIVNTTAALGPWSKRETMLGSLTLLRYETTSPPAFIR